MDARGEGIALRISVTSRCDLRCAYCSSVPDPAGPLSVDEILRFVRAARRVSPVASIRLTGGEPMLRADLPRLVAALAREGVGDLALTTNGQRLAARAADLRAAGLMRVNVSLDSLDPERFARLTGGGDLRRTLAGIETALSVGLRPVKVNAVILRGEPGLENAVEVVALARWALDRGVRIRFLEVMPIPGPRRAPRLVTAAEILAALEREFRVTPLPPERGRTSRNHVLEDRHGRRGVAGIIASVSTPFCAGCRRLRLTSEGRLVSCLARGQGPDVRRLLRSGDAERTRELERAVATAMRGKAPRAAFETALPMVAVGG